MEQIRQQKERDVIVVAVPFPAQGHLNPLLHFSLHLSARGLPVHFASSAAHVRKARARLQGWPDRNPANEIKFHELPLPPFSTPAPDPADCLPLVQLQPPLPDPADFLPFMQLQSPLASLFRSLSAASRRLVIVHDHTMSFACNEADAIPNAETYGFPCISALFLLSLFPDELHGLTSTVVLRPFEDDFTPEMLEFGARYSTVLNAEAGCIFNTCRAIDGEFIELIAQQLPRYRGKKIFAIGPVYPVNAAAKRAGSSGTGEELRNECLQWLDKQPAASVVYVSFGSTTSMSDEQVKQLAVGLQRSGQRFIWVLRDADRVIISADDSSKNQQKRLPVGFEEEIQDVGMIVTGWVPQLEILAHGSTGAFISHCGWNSCMEGLSLGVPIIAWPMHSDQPRNGIMVTDYLKVGVAVRDWDRRKEVVLASQIECSIKRVMVDDEGKEIRKRAGSLGEDIRLALGENGSSSIDFDSFVAHITR